MVGYPAYTLRFDEASFDESRTAERVARRLGLEWISVQGDSRSTA